MLVNSWVESMISKISCRRIGINRGCRSSNTRAPRQSVQEMLPSDLPRREPEALDGQGQIKIIDWDHGRNHMARADIKQLK